ncbi:MAG: methyltransferase domain-containing protein [Oscillospiraceae bacterium]|nr:methyltransferase domain-containing protein [Oscillospiraceae bacterium]
MAEMWDMLDEHGNKTGRLMERGAPMADGEYHLIVHVWIMNPQGEFLISKRTPNKPWPNLWECTGGSAVAGDNSLTTASKEVQEELGLTLDPKNGQMFKRYNRKHYEVQHNDISDVWLFRQDFDINDVVLLPDETCDAVWASKSTILQMMEDGTFIPKHVYPYIDELFYFCDKPFWEIGYHDKNVSTFSKGATADVAAFHQNFKSNSRILDVGCGEGRNSIFLAEQGHTVDAFDLSEAGIAKAKAIAADKGVVVNFTACDVGDYVLGGDYDVILSHGVLHLPEKAVRDKFIANMQTHTKSGGYNLVDVFTNRVPATPDNAPFTKSLFDIGELPAKYDGWTILSHEEFTFCDAHPGGVSHEHAKERITAQKP